MPKEDWIKNPIHTILQRANLWPFGEKEINTVLDVACGLSLKSKFSGASIIVGVDIHEPYLKAIDCSIPYVVIKYDVRNIKDIFLDESFDVVYAIDILEHLEENDSKELLNQCKRIARKAVVIETPNGYIPQNIDIQGFNAHEFQTHRCFWNVDKLEVEGFSCVVRDYKMQDIKRHTDIDVPVDIELITAIYKKG